MPEDIQTILRSVTEDMWLQKLNCIKTGMDEYENNRLNPLAGPIGQIVECYLNPILPTYWEVFHTHNNSRRMTGTLPCRENDRNHLPYYDVGIFLVGFSSLPIALSLAEIQPCEQIYFLYSKDTDYIVAEIEDRIQAMLCRSNPKLVQLVEHTVRNDLESASLKNLESASLKIDSPSDPVATFKRIKEIIDKVGNKHVALDLTGGKKTMIGGGFTAGAILNFANSIRSSACDMFYIDSLEYDPGRGAPVPGTEFLSLLENPYDVYNVQSSQEAKALFDKHNYEAAADLWGRVEKNLKHHAKRYALEAELKAVQSDLGMANCYKLWDAFDYEAAKEHKAFSFAGRKGFWGYNEKHTHDAIDVLDILSEVSDRRTLFKKEERVIHYAVDRYQNAIRRQESGKLDDAIVRFTQVIEMLCSYKICRGIYIVRGKRIPSEFLQDPGAVKTLILFFFNNPACYRNQHEVDCNEFLSIADYGYTDIKNITDLIDYRNKIIHFKNSMTDATTKENTKKLRKLARKFLKDFSCSYCCCQGLSFEDLLELHEFRPASLSPVEQLVEELKSLNCSQADENYAIQIYDEKLPSFEGETQKRIAEALKAYWKNISKWEGNLSDKQREKVCIVQSILNEE